MRAGITHRVISCCLAAILLILSAACADFQVGEKEDSPREISRSLVYKERMETDYAEGFTVDYYEGGYSLISISDGSRFLTVPEGARAPDDLNKEITVLNRPIKNVYLAAAAAMDMFAAIGALDCIAMSSTRENDWYITEAKNAMSSGKISYAGKYSAPDYEAILNSGCALAVESMMILHSPEVKEKLETLGIPVLTDRSSLESHPLGRTEWVKLYGALTGKDAEAKAAFDRQKEITLSVTGGEKTRKTVAFFYIAANGAVNVRKSGDYVPKMIELAGGSYVFPNLGSDNDSSSVNLQAEEFYASAKDADYLVYNGIVDGEISSRDELLEKSEMLADFKAFGEGKVYCLAKNLYQESMSTGVLILDLHKMLTSEATENETFEYLFRLE